MAEKKEKKIKVAVIGGGVSGLSAAWHLHSLNDGKDYDVHVYEKEERLGGHAYTLPVPSGEGDIPVDIGFMVFNSGPHGNYPNMSAWFESMGIVEENSDMSLSVSLDGGDGVEWSSDGLNGLFANRWQALSPKYYTQFLGEMLRFHNQAHDLLLLHKDDPRRQVTTGQFMSQHGYSSIFLRNYLYPMMAALWSASIEDVNQFPAEQLIGFLANHKMLQIFDRPQWKTVQGRSQQYTQKVQEFLGKDRVHLSTPITYLVQPTSGRYDLYHKESVVGTQFEHVIFACHPPTTKTLVENVTDPEVLQLLSEIKYADNTIYVHSDPALMPKRKHAWASWNCLGKSDLIATPKTGKSKKGEAFEGGESGFGATLNASSNSDTNPEEKEENRMKAVYVTYWLNRLQNLESDENYFVSLNPHTVPEADKVHHQLTLAHPQFTPSTVKARKKLLSEQYQGQKNLWYCGAWEGFGFHEDGCRSGFTVATKLSNQPLPWASMETPVLPPPDMTKSFKKSLYRRFSEFIQRDLPIAICKPLMHYFLQQAIPHGKLRLKFNDGSTKEFGDGTPVKHDIGTVTLRIFDPWFYVKTALEYDLGLARSYMAGHYVVEASEDGKAVDPLLRPAKGEVTSVLGDPSGLTRLFLLVIGNRDRSDLYIHRKAARGGYSNALTNASGLVLGKIGSLYNYLLYKWNMNNSEHGGSLKNIHAHYDLSNDLFLTFLDKETYMYSSAIYDGILEEGRLSYQGTLEQAQWRKLDTLLHRAQINKPGLKLLDIGFGWGGLSLHAAKKFGCEVVGITLSVEQKKLAEERVKAAGLEDRITFEVIDYRTFARRPENRGRFDRIVSCEMIEAVGHDHLGEFFWACEQLLHVDGTLVMEAITTPEMRYETYRHTTDFINTIIFPGSCCPSLHALVYAAYRNSCFTLEHVSNIGLHYAQTLNEWRKRFNAKVEQVSKLGFDDVFLRVWNYYFTYCEAGFFSQTEHCLILVWSRQGCQALQPLAITENVTQTITKEQAQAWL